MSCIVEGAATLKAANVPWPYEKLGQTLVMEFHFDRDLTGWKIQIEAQHEFANSNILMDTETNPDKDGDVVISASAESGYISKVVGTVAVSVMMTKMAGDYDWIFTRTTSDDLITEQPLEGVMTFKEEV